MPEIRWLLSELWSLRSLLDVAVVTLLIFWLLGVAQGTRATSLIRGAIIFLALIYILATVFNLETLNWILARTWPALLVAIPVIFQPELRRALEQLGHTGARLRESFPANVDADTEQAIDEIVRAAGQLARQRYGALMIIERETGLQDYAESGVPVDAKLTRQLLINIFYPNSPLHDGAVLTRGDRIVAASVVLPLTDNISASSQLGTRHRAAIGVTEDSDALAVVVSEETGQIAVAHSGRLIRGLDQDRLRRVLRTLMRLDRDETERSTASSRFHLPSADRMRPRRQTTTSSRSGDSAQTTVKSGD
ncbi:MAG: diadenylate cyclase CdaA [Thermomicrobiales bacterium]|nr:diadenylate cyclase CdaA [Thermomicrobiales bacterium]MCO5223177.1 diadenylate cyclase CdaA [Thermomicrobiales bacterium]